MKYRVTDDSGAASSSPSKHHADEKGRQFLASRHGDEGDRFSFSSQLIPSRGCWVTGIYLNRAFFGWLAEVPEAPAVEAIPAPTPDGKPMVAKLEDELVEVLNKYTHLLTVAEAVGALEIVKLDVYQRTLEASKEEEA